MVARNRARYLAPVALLAAVAATLVVISSATRSHRSAPPAQTAVTISTRRRAGSHHTVAAPVRTYTVQAGDTLSGIAAKTGVPLSTLESLNPNANPTGLQTGERLRLR